jgi:hypothetical protein
MLETTKFPELPSYLSQTFASFAWCNTVVPKWPDQASLGFLGV